MRTFPGATTQCMAGYKTSECEYETSGVSTSSVKMRADKLELNKKGNEVNIYLK